MQYLLRISVLIIVFFSLIACGSGKITPSSIPNTAEVKSITSTSLSANERTENNIDYKSYSVANIVNCGQGIEAGIKRFSLFPNSNNQAQNQSLSKLNFSGWNHSIKGNVTEWTNLKLTGSNYNFNDEIKTDNSCSNVQTFDMILVKKIANWDRQHANGFECNVLAQGYKFGDIENLVFDLKINSSKTKIPSIESLKTTYESYVNDSIVDAVDDGKVNVGITLSDNTNLNASIIIQLDQVVLSDKWVRVTIPMSKLTFYQEINYKRTTKIQADLNDVVINRILIVGETKTGAILRRSISPWDANVPETFKEMDLSFKKIEFQLR